MTEKRERGNYFKRAGYLKTTKNQRNMSLIDSTSGRSFNSEDSEANLAKVEDEQSDCESQVSCESLENDVAYADELLADDEWITKNKGDFCLIGCLNL